MKTILIIQLLFCFCFSAISQNSDSIMVWKFKINYIIKNSLDHNFSEATILNSFTYFQNNHLIFRHEDRIKNDAFSKANKNERNVNINLYSEFVNSVYLLNLKNNLSYTFFKDEKGIFIVKDSIKNNGEELLYKFFSVKLPNLTFDTQQKVSIVSNRIASNSLYFTTGVSKDGAITHYWMNNDKVAYKSPLNFFYPNTTSNVIALCSPKNKFANEYGCFVLEKIEKVLVPKRYFIVPQQRVIDFPKSYQKISQYLFDPF